MIAPQKQIDTFHEYLAPYACHPSESRGRLYSEPSAESRSAFQRDRDRIIHCGAFRKLEYKTQVFVNHEGDYYRTRLTHSLEVSQISRSIARSLNLNEDLAEALALAHDLGHTPFGHAGEDALDEAMKSFGGFNHNMQTLRILTHLERRYADFDGLNLTWETLEGTIKHNGPVKKPFYNILENYLKKNDLEVHTYASLEAQVASLSDDIAYNNHDIDDGLRAELFTVEDLMDVPLVGPVFRKVREAYPNIENSRLVHEAIRRMIHYMVQDVIDTTTKNIQAHRPESVDDVRQAGSALVEFSAEMIENNKALKDFLRQRMYSHYKVNRMTSKARRVVKELFAILYEEPECLPEEWRQVFENASDKNERAVVVADYIAGMTDRYAMFEHRKLFDIYTKND